MRSQRGNAIIETAMFVPVFIILLVGMAEIARVTYVYYTLQKTLYNLARFIGTRQGVNLCDQGDPELQTAKNWAVTGSSSGGDPILAGLQPEMIQVRVERQEPGSDILGECDCGSIGGCNAGLGSRPPDFVVVSVPDGFAVNILLPYLASQTVTFRPTVRVPFGGT
jgi:hypothetical protein